MHLMRRDEEVASLLGVSWDHPKYVEFINHAQNWLLLPVTLTSRPASEDDDGSLVAGLVLIPTGRSSDEYQRCGRFQIYLDYLNSNSMEVENHLQVVNGQHLKSLEEAYYFFDESTEAHSLESVVDPQGRRKYTITIV
jgi:hypothetical protein